MRFESWYAYHNIQVKKADSHALNLNDKNQILILHWTVDKHDLYS